MSNALLYHKAVRSDLRNALDHYENISHSLADDFWDELVGAFEYARQYPERHHFDVSGKRRSNLKRFPYHFLFKVNPSGIKILALRHNSQNPSYGNRRK